MAGVHVALRCALLPEAFEAVYVIPQRLGFFFSPSRIFLLNFVALLLPVSQLINAIIIQLIRAFFLLHHFAFIKRVLGRIGWAYVTLGLKVEAKLRPLL